MAYYGDVLDGDCQYLLEFEGASRSIPYSTERQAGAGAALYVCEEYSETWSQIGVISTYLGHATCNQAEYSALILGLEAAYDAGVRNVQVRGDSKLVVKQADFHEFLSCSKLFQVEHIYRHINQNVDGLANEAIDGGGWEGLQNLDGELIAYPRGSLPIW